jgi:AraC-like DNA-binding protein
VQRKPIPTISIHVVRGAFAEAIAHGEDPAALCARFGLTPEQLADTDARVGADVMRRIWSELPTVIGVNDFGLAVARRAESAGALSVIGYLLRAAPTVGEGLKLALRFQRLVQDAVTSTWIARGDDVEVVLEERDPAFRLPRHAIEFGFASMTLGVRSATGRDLGPRRVAFRHPRPGDDREAQAVFACALEYGAPANAVTFAQAVLDVPHRSSDPHLSELLLRHARDLEDRLPETTSFATVVRSVLARDLERGEIGLATVARGLRLRPRTVQRRLHGEGTSLQRVLDELRRDLALHHLEDGELSILEVGLLLGFADQSSFHHAFVRWTGLTPGAYRLGAR